MAYKRISPMPVVEGGTGAQTLTSNGVLLGNTTSAITATTAGTTGQVLAGNTGLAPSFQAASSISLGTTNHAVQVGNASGTLTSLGVGATGTTLMGSTGADPAFTGSPSFSGTATAGTGLVATTGGITATGNSSINTSGTGTNAIGTGTNSGTISIGNTNSAVVNIDCGTAGINVGATANAHASVFGSTNSTSATTVQSGSGALAVTSTNGTLTINSGTGALGISTDASATTVSFATGAGVKTVILGSTNTTSTTTLQAGSGGVKLGAVAEGALVTSSTSVISTVTGTEGFVLTANAAGTAPSFQAIPASSSKAFMGLATALNTSPINNTAGARYCSLYFLSLQSTESPTQFVVPIAGTFKNLYVNAITNANTDNGTFTLRVNGASTSVVATVNALTTGIFSDTTHTAAVNAGDLVNLSISKATTGTITGSWSIAFTS